MRKLMVCIATVAVVAYLFLPAAAACIAGESLEGRYKITLLIFGEDEFLLLDMKSVDSKLQATVVDAQPFLGSSPKVTNTKWHDGVLELTITSPEMENSFLGHLVTKGDQAGEVLGTFRFRGDDYPARLEKTDAEKVGTLSRSQLSVDLLKVRRETHTPARVEKLKELLKKYPGPSLHLVYSALLSLATEGGLSTDEVSKYVRTWLDDAKQYGDRWLTQCRTKALAALDGQKEFAPLAVKIANEAEAATSDETPTEQRAAIASALARAAELAGDEQLAATARRRSEKFEAQLDKEYLANVPPFKPETYAGRTSPEQDRTVLLELFTGAQCPPCVAADVAFDAVLKSYKTSEVLALQYHLHIPGPDPLTCEDSNQRQTYYKLRGTPSAYFNGEELAPGGGGMGNAEQKYAMYRAIINQRLAGKAKATIDLELTRSGNQLLVTVSARAAEIESEKTTGGEKDADATEDADQEEDEEPQVHLRLALTEESIRYVGGNNLRFHHHVVRAMPGGVEGKQLVAGQVQVELTIDLDEIRANQEAYLKAFAQSVGFPKPLPPIALKNLALVAFVQDDATKEVLHAVSVKIEDK